MDFDGTAQCIAANRNDDMSTQSNEMFLSWSQPTQRAAAEPCCLKAMTARHTACHASVNGRKASRDFSDVPSDPSPSQQGEIRFTLSGWKGVHT